jgi:hypothetical protein
MFSRFFSKISNFQISKLQNYKFEKSPNFEFKKSPNFKPVPKGRSHSQQNVLSELYYRKTAFVKSAERK